MKRGAWWKKKPKPAKQTRASFSPPHNKKKGKTREIKYVFELGQAKNDTKADELIYSTDSHSDVSSFLNENA